MGTIAKAVLQEKQGRTIHVYQTEYRDENREYGGGDLGKVRTKLTKTVGDDGQKMSDLAEFVAVAVLEIAREGVPSNATVLKAQDVLRGRSESEIHAKLAPRFAAYPEVLGSE